MNPTKVAPEKSDEIDLVALVQKLLNFFRRYGALILISAVIGAVSAFLWSRLQPRLYSSSLLLRPTLMSVSEQTQAVANWSNMLNQKGIDDLARLFNCSPATLQELQSITAKNTSESSANTSFLVIIEVTDTAVIKDIQKGILHAFESADFIKDKLTRRRAAFQQLIDVTSHEIKMHDSMRDVIQKSLAGNGRAMSPMIVSVSDLNTTNLLLNERLVRLQDSLKFNSGAYVLQSFYRPTAPDTIPVIFILLGGAVLGAALGVAISLLLILRKNLKAASL